MTPSDSPELDPQRKKLSSDLLKNVDRFYKKGDLSSALEEVEHSLEIDPGNFYARAYKERILTAMNQPDQKNAESDESAEEISGDLNGETASPDGKKTDANLERQARRKEEASLREEEMKKQDHLELQKKIQADRQRQEDDKRKVDEQQKRAEEIIRRRELELEVSQRRMEEEKSKSAEARRRAEEELRQKEADMRRKLEEERRQVEDEQKKIREDARRQAEADAKVRAEEERKRKAQEEEQRRRDTEERKRAEEAARQKHEEELRKRLEEEKIRRQEEELIRNAREEARQEAARIKTGEYLAAAKDAMVRRSYDEVLRYAYRVLAIDPSNNEARQFEQLVASEGLTAREQQIQEAREIPLSFYHDTYKRLLKNALSDGELTSIEENLLKEAQGILKISPDQHFQLLPVIQEDAYTDAVRIAWEDGSLSPEEVTYLERLRTELSITAEQHLSIEQRVRRELS